MPITLIFNVHVGFLAVLLSGIVKCRMGLHFWQDLWAPQDHQSWIILGLARFFKWVKSSASNPRYSTHLVPIIHSSIKTKEKILSASTELGLTSHALRHQTSPNAHPHVCAHMHVSFSSPYLLTCFHPFISKVFSFQVASTPRSEFAPMCPFQKCPLMTTSSFLVSFKHSLTSAPPGDG